MWLMEHYAHNNLNTKWIWANKVLNKTRDNNKLINKTSNKVLQRSKLNYFLNDQETNQRQYFRYD